MCTNAVDVLEPHIQIEKVLEHYGFQVRGEGVLRGKCLIHGGDNPSSFVVNTENNLWYCHTGCGGGDVYSLIMKMDNLNFPDAVRKVASLHGIDVDGCVIAPINTLIRDTKRWIQVIQRSMKEELQEYVLPCNLFHVNTFRGFTKETIEHFGLRYAKEYNMQKKSGEEVTLHNRLVFPIVIRGKVVGASLRSTKSVDVPKWIHQPTSINTSRIFYNGDVLQKHSSAIICEGIPDVWRWFEAGYENTVCSFGAHLTDEQVEMLLQSVTDVYLSFDDDDAGKSATQKAIKLLQNKCNIYVIKLPKHDPCDCTSEELQNSFVCKKHWTEVYKDGRDNKHTNNTMRSANRGRDYTTSRT